MAAKVGFASAVSYGIGVQNRYSAFLDDEDAINSPIPDHVSKQIASKQQQSHKGGSTVSFHQTGKPGANNQSSSSVKSSAPANRNAPANSRQNQSDHQQAKSNELNQQRRQVESGKRQPRSNGQPQNGIQHAQGTKQYQHGNANKPANHSQESAANNKFPRNHQQLSNQSQSGLNKENNEGGYNSQHNPNRESKFSRPPQNQRRQFHNGDEKKGLNNTSNDDSTNAGPSFNEDHKRRRQQKRAIDMKHKDPEKREARRQQVTDQQQQTNNHKESVQNSKIDNAVAKGFRNRRDADQGEGNTKVNADDTNNNRGFRGRRGLRAKAGEHGDANHGNGEQKSSGPENGSSRGARNRPPRKTGFAPGSGPGSRTARGPRADDKSGNGNIEMSKPIPNFSDKLDFPSLAS